MTLKEKCQEAMDFVVELLSQYKKPVLMCSFGKDSMVLLHLLRSHGISVQSVFYTDPWFPEKYGFARKIIELWGLEVYDYPPAHVAMMYGKSIAAFVNQYQVGPKTMLAVPKNIIEYQDGDKKWLCGLNDFLLRPKGTFEFPWDVLLIGHKDVDSDQIYGDVPLHTRLLKRDEGPDYAYPMKDWTHDDVWDYTKKFKVPIQTSRYDVAKRTEVDDKYYNSDYWPGCIRCIDKRLAGTMVSCPRLGGKMIPNISEKVNEFTWTPDYFG